MDIASFPPVAASAPDVTDAEIHARAWAMVEAVFDSDPARLTLLHAAAMLMATMAHGQPDPIATCEEMLAQHSIETMGTRMRGVALHEADNTDGIAGAASVETERGPFLVANDGTVNRTHIGGNVFVVDDNTVGAAGTLVAGKCLDVTPAGVTVEIL